MRVDRPRDDVLELVDQLRAARPALVIDESFARALAGAIAAARAAWGEVALEEAEFVRFLADKLEEPAERSLSSLRIGDLYLACACDRGDARALAAFDREFAPVIDRAVASLGASPAEQVELRQVVRVRLLVARDGEGSRIAGFSGRGTLAAWVRVVATREAARLLRRERRAAPAEDDALAATIAPEADPELGYLKRLYRDEFRAAFHAAVDALSDRERVLLRQHALDGLSIDRLAALYHVHRATVARWVAAARKAVLDGTRGALARRLQLRPGELDSIMRLIDSQLDVSLPGALRGRG